jgi:hypothetical protein
MFCKLAEKPKAHLLAGTVHRQAHLFDAQRVTIARVN